MRSHGWDHTEFANRSSVDRRDSHQWAVTCWIEVQSFCVWWRGDVAKMRTAPENAIFTQNFAISATPGLVIVSLAFHLFVVGTTKTKKQNKKQTNKKRKTNKQTNKQNKNSKSRSSPDEPAMNNSTLLSQSTPARIQTDWTRLVWSFQLSTHLIVPLIHTLDRSTYPHTWSFQ